MNIVVLHQNSQSFVKNGEVVITINDLSSIGDATCDSLHLGDSMDFIPYEERTKLLQTACKKLKYNGLISLSGNDSKAIARDMFFNNTSDKQINSALYGGRLSIEHLNQTMEKLRKLGLDIVDAKLDGLFYSIKAKRNGE